MLLPAAVTHVNRITVSYPGVDSSVRYNNVTTHQSVWAYVTALTLENRFFLRQKVGRWFSDIGGTVGSPQQQLGFLFCGTQVAFMSAYAYRYRID